MFLLGNWKNYDELEENLSIEELIATLNAERERRQDERKFMAAVQGIDISDKEPVNITDISPYEVAQTGFGVGLGIGHGVQSVNEDAL